MFFTKMVFFHCIKNLAGNRLDAYLFEYLFEGFDDRSLLNDFHCNLSFSAGVSDQVSVCKS